MANKRIKDLATTATAPAGDDYFALDGATNGTRKMLGSGLVLAQTLTDNAILRADGTAGQVQNGVLIIADTTGALSGFASGAGITLHGGGTITGASGVVSINGVALVGTNATTMTFPTTSPTLARTDAANSFTGIQTILGTSTLKFGATAAATIGVSADTLAGILDITPPATSATVRINGSGGAILSLTRTGHADAYGIFQMFGNTGVGWEFGCNFVAVGSNRLEWRRSASGAAGYIDTAGNLFTANVNAAGGTLTIGATTSQITGAAGNMTITAGTGNSRTLTLQTTTSGGTATNAIVIGDTQAVTSYKNIATEGDGLLATRKVGRITAQTGAATICTLTTPAADASYRVSANILITAAVAVSTSINVDYTDESNTARTMILPLTGLAGTFVAGGLAVAAQPYESPAIHIRTKASSTITISTAAGTFTTVTYNAEAAISQIQ